MYRPHLRPVRSPRPTVATVTVNYNSLDPGNAESSLVSRAFQHGFLPGTTFKVVTSSAVYDHPPALAKVDYPPPVPPTTPEVGCIAVPETPATILCNYHPYEVSASGTIQTPCPESCNTGLRPDGDGPSRTSLNNRGRGVRVQQARSRSTSPMWVSPTSRRPPNSSTMPRSRRTRQLGQGASVRWTSIATTLQMAMVAEGHHRPGIDHDAARHGKVRDLSGDLIESYRPTPWLRATTGYRRSSDPADAGVVTRPGARRMAYFADEDVAAETGIAEASGAFGQKLTDAGSSRLPQRTPRPWPWRSQCPTRCRVWTGAAISGPPTAAILRAVLGYVRSHG